MRKLKSSPFWAIAMVAALGVGLSACGGDSDTAEAPPVVEPMPTPFEAATAAIAAATTAAAAQKAVDDAAANVSGAELRQLQAAADARVAALATMASAAEQRRALMTAAGMIDTSDLSTADAIAAANAAIAALKAAIAEAVDVADTSMYQAQVDAAESAVMTAQGALDTAGRMTVQREAISNAVTTARTAVGMVDDDATDEDVTAADAAIAALRAAIAGAADLPAGDAAVASGQGTLDTLVIQLVSAKSSRMMAMNEAAGKQRQANINAARDVLTNAEEALGELADDATDEERRDANRMVESAANALRDSLRMNGGSDADIEAAIRKSAAAKVAADALQGTITAAAEAEEKRKMKAIETAQKALTGAEETLAGLGEDATDKEKRDAHRAVETAAATLIQVLEDNDGTADQITAATMKRNSAKMMADALTSPIEITDQRKAITDALTTLARAVVAVDDEATDAEVKAADDAVTAARKAITDATELPEAEKSAHGLLVDAHASTLSSAKSSRLIAVNKKAEDEREIAKAASNKVATSKKTAIDAERTTVPGDTVASRPFDRTGADSEYVAVATGAAADTNDDRNYRVQVKHDGGSKVTITDGNLEAKSDPMFATVATFGNGQMLERNVGTDREIIVVHTDIEGPTATPFSQAPGIELDADTDPDFTGPESINISTTADANNHFDGMASTRFRYAGDGATHTINFVSADATATPPVKASEFSGTYDGALGAYKCSGTLACTVVVNNDNDVTAVTGTWQFTPAAGATVSVQDNDYLTYGFWLDTTTRDGEIASYDTVQTFATSSLTVSTGLSNVTGSAEYEGDSAGVYVHETKKEDGTLDKATAGRFTADVSLTAYFDATGVFATNTIGGSISEFDLDGGPDVSWNVNVSASGIDTDAGFTGSASGMTGNTGSLTGRFYGPTPTTPSTTDDAGATVAPPVLIGEFNANFTNGAVAGAYGARKQP